MKRDISRRERLTLLVGESSRVNLGNAAVSVWGGGGAGVDSLFTHSRCPGPKIYGLFKRVS